MGPVSSFLIDLEREELLSTNSIPYAIELDLETYKELIKETSNKDFFGPYRILVTNEEFSRSRFLYTREHIGNI
jgi:hypothetical protein